MMYDCHFRTSINYKILNMFCAIILIAAGGRKVTQTIYVDILFCLNFIIDYIILLTVKKFLSLDCGQKRLLLGAAVGGVCSFAIFLPPLPSGLSMVVSMLTACAVVAAAFCPLNRKVFIKTSAAFFLISFCYCGAMIALWIIFSPKNIVIRNNSVYIAVSPIVLVITTLFCYIVLRVIMRITGRGVPKQLKCRAVIEYNGITKKADGTVDTGNTLKEPFSGECVIVAREEIFKDMFDAADCMKISGNSDNSVKGVRLVPFNSVGGTGVIPAVKPDIIKLKIGNEEIKVSAYLAFCKGENMTEGTDMLVPAELIMKGS